MLTAKQAEEGRSHGTGPPQLVKEALLQGVPSPELRPQARFERNRRKAAALSAEMATE